MTYAAPGRPRWSSTRNVKCSAGRLRRWCYDPHTALDREQPGDTCSLMWLVRPYPALLDTAGAMLQFAIITRSPRSEGFDQGQEPRSKARIERGPV